MKADNLFWYWPQSGVTELLTCTGPEEPHFNLSSFDFDQDDKPRSHEREIRIVQIADGRVLGAPSS